MPRRSPRRLAVLLLVLALAACADGAPAPTDEVDLQPDADDRSATPAQLILAIGGEPDDGYDPTLGWGRYGSPLFQSTLLRRDAQLEIVGDLATDWSVSDDGRTWTVSIRDDVTFHDGEPLTAADVAYTYETAASRGGLVDLADLASAVVLDDTTVELTLTQPRSTFLAQLTTVGIVPAHAHGEGYGRDPVGSGPFVLERWAEGQELVVTRNEDYHGELPAFERLVFLFTDEDGSLAAARTGDVQVAGLPQTLATDDVDGMELVAVPSVDNRGVMFPIPMPGGTTEDDRPIGNAVTADLAIRQALNLAVDRATLAEAVLEGYGTPAYGPVDGMPWFEPTTMLADADLDAAAAILTDGGWEDAAGDGVLVKDGVEARFTLLYPASDSVRQALALSFRDMVAPLGIEVEVDGAGWDAIGERMHADAVLFGWGSHDQTEMYNLHHSSRAGVEFFNTGFFVDDQVDTYLDLAMGATDPAEAEVWWRAAQLDEDGNGFAAPAQAAWAWLVNLDHTYLVDACLDLGETQVEPHGHGWPVTSGITGWRWTC
jgi:peptide/nickel transport system substrate-binding protein